MQPTELGKRLLAVVYHDGHLNTPYPNIYSDLQVSNSAPSSMQAWRRLQLFTNMWNLAWTLQKPIIPFSCRSHVLSQDTQPCSSLNF